MEQGDEAEADAGQNWKEKYSWSTAPRWDRQAFEAGAYTRVWATAAAQKIPSNDFVVSTGERASTSTSRKCNLPEMEMSWRIPSVWNTFERNRARAYAILFNNAVAMNNWLQATELLSSRARPKSRRLSRSRRKAPGSASAIRVRGAVG